MISSPHQLMLISLISLCLSGLADAHPFHSSSAEMEWNAKTQRFEVSWKIDPNDLEQELRRRAKKRIILEKLDDHEIVFEYIRDTFRVECNGDRLEFKPVGFEVDSKDAWVYFEIPGPNGLSDLKIKNELLLNVHHQINTLLIRRDKHRITLTFTDHQRVRDLAWEAKSKQFRAMNGLNSSPK